MPRNNELTKAAIGGSEVAAILGLDPLRSGHDIWLVKKGLVTVQPNYRMIKGKCLERGIIELYAHVTNQEIVWIDKTAINATRPWQSYTPDALVINRNPNEFEYKKGVDAKLVSYDQRHKWGETVDEIPKSAFLQALWYANGMDLPAWDIAAMIGDDDDPRIYTVDRDPELEEVILAETETWWKKYLVGNEEPPLGASEATGDWIRQKYPRANSRIRQATDAEIAWMRKYNAIRETQKPLEQSRQELENLLINAVGEDAGIICGQGKFTWKKTESGGTDWKGLATMLMLLATPEQREGWLKHYARDGFRRIAFKWDSSK